MIKTILLIVGGFFLLGLVLLTLVSLLTSDRKTSNELWRLYLTELVIVGLIIGPALLGGIVFTLVMALMGLVALWEFYQVTMPNQSRLLRMSALIIAGVVFAGSYTFNSTEVLYQLTLFGVMILLIINIFLPTSGTASYHTALTSVGLIYPVLFLAHLPLIIQRPNGYVAIVFLYLTVELFDTFALLGGKLFGRHKIFPQLSPNKTYAGVLSGGLITMVSMSVLNMVIFNYAWMTFLGLMVVLIIATLLGDLVASKFKRNAGVKDYGQVLPGQGGVLDIYDSLIFASPIFYLIVAGG